MYFRIHQTKRLFLFQNLNFLYDQFVMITFGIDFYLFAVPTCSKIVRIP
jgi:hypothetical protein